MTLVSISFLIFIFLTILCYFTVPRKGQWIVLLIASYLFFFSHSHWLVLILMGTSLFTYFIARRIHAIGQKGKAQLAERASELNSSEKKAFKAQTKRRMKRVLMLGVGLDLGILLFLKYCNFFTGSINHILPSGFKIPSLKLILPLGISFYTLQAIAYLVDIYREKYAPDRNPFQFMLFMAYFPQILQGPIPRHNQLAHQLYTEHTYDGNRCVQGLMLMAWGYFKKMVIADRIAAPVNAIFGNNLEYTGIMIFCAAIGYGIQVYADFSGGMDVVRGISQIFGIELVLNFRQPYFSRSIEEFWRRWHITLGSWMRDYVFYPLSLSKTFSRMGKAAMKTFGKYIGKRLPAFAAMFIVYFLVGFWHGPDMKYIVYGLWNGLFIVSGILLETPYQKIRTRLRIRDEAAGWRIFQMIRTFCICSIGRLFSRADSLSTAWQMLCRMFRNFADTPILTMDTALSLNLSIADGITLVIAILTLLAVDYLHERDFHLREIVLRKPLVLRWIIYYAVIAILLIFSTYGPGYDSASFIYEQF